MAGAVAHIGTDPRLMVGEDILGELMAPAQRNFPSSSVAASMPVKPAPTTSAVNCPGECGCAERLWMWVLSRAAPS